MSDSVNQKEKKNEKNISKGAIIGIIIALIIFIIVVFFYLKRKSYCKNTSNYCTSTFKKWSREATACKSGSWWSSLMSKDGSFIRGINCSETI